MSNLQTANATKTCTRCRPASDDVSHASWEKRYRESQTGWDRGGPNPQLQDWLSTATLSPSRVLVPGCGFGHEVVELARAGFDVTAVDFAEAAITKLKKLQQVHELDYQTIHSDLFAFSPSDPFDAIYEQTCLCAIDPSQWETYEQLLCCWLKPNGRLFALFMQTGAENGPPFHCSMEQMRELFAFSRWNWIEEGIRVDHPSGLYEIATVLERKEESCV